MKPSRSLRYVRYAAWVCLALALLCVAIQCIWRAEFERGHVAGIPRLFNALGRIVPWLTRLLALGFVAVLTVWIIRMLQRKPRHGQVAITAGILLLAIFASFSSMLASIFEISWTAMDSINIHGATYSLVAEEGLLGTSYGLVRCDQPGVVCQIVAWFGSPGWYLPYRLPAPSLQYESATDRLLVTVGGKAYTWQFGLPGGAPLLNTPRPEGLNDLHAMAWSPDGRRLASGWKNGLIVWDVESGQQVRVPEGDMYVTALAWSPNGARVAATLAPVYEQPTDGRVIGIWDTASGQRVRTLAGHGEWVSEVAWSPDGTQLASGTDLSGTIILWDVETGQKVHTLPEDHSSTSFRWSPDGTRLAAGYGDGVVILWDVESGRQLRTFPGGSGVYVEWSPDGTRLASYYWGTYYNHTEGTAIVWDVETGAKLYVLTEQHIISGALNWSPAGIRLATSGDSTILWDVATGEKLRTLDVPSYISTWSPDGTRLATGAKGGPIIIWDVETGKQLWTLSKD